MAHPRKFVEKIAIHNQKMAEETRAFEEIMKEVSVLGSSIKANSTQNQQYRSLPNVNLGFGPNHIDLQKALMNLDNMQRPSLVDRGPIRDHRRYTAIRSTPFPKRNFGVDPSPYHSAPPYLSPPQMDQGQNWRRAISDSSLHQTVMGGHHQIKEIDINKLGELKRAGSPQSRPRSCEVPGIKMYPTSEQASPISSPQLANTGSLPDLTNLHIPSPLQTPIDNEEIQMSQSASPPHYQTSPRPSHMRRHTHSPVMDKQSYPPPMPYIDPNISPLELRLQQFQPYQQSPSSNSDVPNQFGSHSTTVSSPTMSPSASTSMSPLFKNFPNTPLSPLTNDVPVKQQHNNSFQQQIQPDPFGLNFGYGGQVGLQQRMQLQNMLSQQQQQQGMNSPNSFAQFYAQAGSRVPDLIVTSEDEESQRLDFARELSSAMVAGGSHADFYNNDDPVELGQLDMESLQMLSGQTESEVADQATEDQFRMDRMSGSYGFP